MMTQYFSVFVYGTLKQGQPNHFIMDDVANGTAKFIAKGSTIQKYPLVIASKYNIPYLLDRKAVGKSIHGEIYSVNEDMLKVLDDLEGHPKYYVRREETITCSVELNQTKTISCWTYFLPQFRDELLDLEFHDVYDTNGSHGLKYVESEETECMDDIYE